MNLITGIKSFFARTYGATFRIERHLSHIAKYVGYVGMFIVTPLLAILGYYEISPINYFSSPELTPAQQEARVHLRLLNLPTTTNSALSSLNRNDGQIDLYLSSGLVPDDSKASKAIKKQIDSAMLTVNAEKYIPILERRDPSFATYLSQLRRDIASFSETIRDAYAGKIESEQFCARINSANTISLVRTFGKTIDHCREFVAQSNFVEKLSETNDAMKRLRPLGWSGPDFQVITGLANLATLNERSKSPVPRTHVPLDEQFSAARRTITVLRAKIRISSIPKSNGLHTFYFEGHDSSSATPIDQTSLQGGRSTWECNENFCRTDLLLMSVDGRYYALRGYTSKGAPLSPGSVSADYSAPRCPPANTPNGRSCVTVDASLSPRRLLHRYIQRISIYYESALNCAKEIKLEAFDTPVASACRALIQIAPLERWDKETYDTAYRQLDYAIGKIAYSSITPPHISLAYTLKAMTALFTRWRPTAVNDFDLAIYFAERDGNRHELIVAQFGYAIAKLTERKCEAAKVLLDQYRRKVETEPFPEALVISDSENIASKCGARWSD